MWQWMSRRWFGMCAFLSFALLLWLVAVGLGPSVFQGYSIAVVVVSAGLVASWPLRSALGWFSKQDLFAPWIAFPIAYCVWFFVGSLDLTGDPYPPPYGLIALGLGCYLAGVLVGRLGRGGRVEVIQSRVEDTWSPERLRTCLFLIGAVTFGAYVLIAAQMGIPGLRPNAGEERLKLLNYGKSQFVFLCGAWTVLVFLGTRLWVGRGKSKSNVRILLLIALFSFMILSLGSRDNLLTPVATLLIARHYLYRRTNLRWAIPLAAIAFVGASALGWARDTAVYSGTSFWALGLTARSSFFLYYYVHDSVTVLRDIVDLIPRSTPYQHGYLSFGALASLLPGHHVSNDMFFRQLVGLDFVGFGSPATLLGPMYGDFGVWGVAVQMLALGYGYTRLYFWMHGSPTVLRALIYGWTSQVVLYSLLTSLLGYLALVAVPLGWLALHGVLRSEAKQSSSVISDGRSQVAVAL